MAPSGRSIGKSPGDRSTRTRATLDYFMRDYVAHMEHHLRQILS
jgi:hypothetical protein